MSLRNLYLSSFVKRWHTDPWLSEWRQTNGHHQWGVATLIAVLHPAPPARLLLAALTHDAGEILTGDIPYGFKKLYGGGGIVEAVEQAGEVERDDMLGVATGTLDLADEEQAWLEMADRLEAWLFVSVASPDMLATRDWQECERAILEAADALGVGERVREMMGLDA